MSRVDSVVESSDWRSSYNFQQVQRDLRRDVLLGGETSSRDIQRACIASKCGTSQPDCTIESGTSRKTSLSSCSTTSCGEMGSEEEHLERYRRRNLKAPREIRRSTVQLKTAPAVQRTQNGYSLRGLRRDVIWKWRVEIG